MHWQLERRIMTLRLLLLICYFFTLLSDSSGIPVIRPRNRDSLSVDYDIAKVSNTYSIGDSIVFTLPHESLEGTVRTVEDQNEYGTYYAGDMAKGTFKMIISPNYVYFATVEIPEERVYHQLSLSKGRSDEETNSYKMVTVSFLIYEAMENNSSDTEQAVRSEGQGSGIVHRHNKELQGHPSDYSPIGTNYLDVLIIYTPEMFEDAGGTKDAINNVCAISIIGFIEALKDSIPDSNDEPDFSLRLLGCLPVADDYVEKKGYKSFDGMLTEMREDLINMEGSPVVSLNTKRNELGADAVHMLVANNEICGIASFNPLAYTDGLSVGNWECSSRHGTMSHEIGHNLGLSHDRSSFPTGEQENNLFSYGHCWDTTPTSKSCGRTIMAYPTCKTASGNMFCNKVQLFSNPDISVRTSMGPVATGTALNNNVRRLKENIATAVNWRAHVEQRPSFAPTSVPVVPETEAWVIYPGLQTLSSTDNAEGRRAGYYCFAIDSPFETDVVFQTFNHSCYDTLLSGDAYIVVRRDSATGSVLFKNDDQDYPFCTDSQISVTLSAGTYCLMMGCYDSGNCSYSPKIVGTTLLPTVTPTTIITTISTNPTAAPTETLTAVPTVPSPVVLMTGTLNLTGTSSAFNDHAMRFRFSVNTTSDVVVQTFKEVCYDTMKIADGDAYIRLYKELPEGNEEIAENDDIQWPECIDSMIELLSVDAGDYYLQMGCYSDSACSYEGKIVLRSSTDHPLPTVMPTAAVTNVYPPSDGQAALFFNDVQTGAMSHTNCGSSSNATSFCFELSDNYDLVIQTFADDCYDTRIENGDAYIRLIEEASGETIAENDDLMYPECMDSKLEVYVESNRYCALMGCYGDTACSYRGTIRGTRSSGRTWTPTVKPTLDPHDGSTRMTIFTGAMTDTHSASNENAVHRCFSLTSASLVRVQTFDNECYDTRVGDVGDTYIRLNNEDGDTIAENDDLSYPQCSDSEMVSNVGVGTYCVLFGCYSNTSCSYTGFVVTEDADEPSLAPIPPIERENELAALSMSSTNSASNENATSYCFNISSPTNLVVQTFTDFCYDTRIGDVGDSYIRVNEGSPNGNTIAENDDQNANCTDSKLNIDIIVGTYCVLLGCYSDTPCSFVGKIVGDYLPLWSLDSDSDSDSDIDPDDDTTRAGDANMSSIHMDDDMADMEGRIYETNQQRAQKDGAPLSTIAIVAATFMGVVLTLAIVYGLCHSRGLCGGRKGEDAVKGKDLKSTENVNICQLEALEENTEIFIGGTQIIRL